MLGIGQASREHWGMGDADPIEAEPIDVLVSAPELR